MKKVVVGGCFDLLHYGHFQFLKKAKEAGDILVVLLESDEKVRQLKGVNRPIHNQSHRAEMLRSLKMVDEVVNLPSISRYEEYLEILKKIKPDIIAITSGDPKKDLKEKMAKEVGAKLLVVTPLLPGFSTTSILKDS